MASAPQQLGSNEPWDHLARHRARKQACISDAQAIQDSCPKDPGHNSKGSTPVSDCKHCHRKIIERISHRYLDSPETEWYGDRRTFLQHLAELFPLVKRGEADAKGIEDRVMDEKRKWHRENVRRVAKTLGELGLPDRREELFRLLDDRKMKFPEFCARVREVVGRGRAPVPEGSLERLVSTRDDPTARVEAYKEIFFFPDGEKEEVKESTRKYLEMIEQGMSMSKVASRMVEDKKQAIRDQKNLEDLRSRIETLQKAKETWLVTQRRSRDADEEKPDPPPPCFQCRRQPEAADPPSCALCQLAVAHEILEEPVVYCSEECQRRGHGAHVEEAHKCAAGEHCVTLYRPDEDEIDDPTNVEGDVYLCRSCLENGRSLQIYCTRPCADANFQHHRDEAHDWRDTEARFVMLEQALEQMQDEKVIDKLEFLPRLSPAVKAPKQQAADDRDVHMDIGYADDTHRRAEAHVDSTNTAATNEKAPERPPSPLRRHDDDTTGDVKMEGVESKHISEPAIGSPPNNNNTDAEMMDAVDVADFAARTAEDAERNAQTAAAAAPSEQQQASKDAAQKPSPPPKESERQQQPSPTSQPVIPSTSTNVKPTPMKDPIPCSSPSNPAERIPIASPKAAAEVLQQPPSTTMISPSRIKSTEPMPSLGRSLEIEIAKIPAGGEVRSHVDDEPVRTDDKIVRDRYRDVGDMDEIADEKARDIDYRRLRNGSGMENDERKKDDGGEMEGKMKGGMNEVDEAAVRGVLDKPLPESKEGRERNEKKDSGKKDGEKKDGSDKSPAPWDSIPDPPVNRSSPSKDNTTTTSKPARKESPKQPPLPDAAADSMEEGEISEGPPPSAHSRNNNNKRKASSPEPGEVAEDEGNNRNNSDGRRPPEAKKARSVDKDADRAADRMERD